jgi:penicillin-binding protein 1A
MAYLVVIMDPYTGEIVALAGGVGEKTINFGLNRIYSQRPPGSSIKPLAVYGPALEYGLISQNTLVNDSPDVTLSGTWWYPRNAGGGYSGIITIRQALTNSINTVSAQIVDKLTPAASYEYLVNKLGVTSLVEADADYAPMALGQLTNGITVREMAQAYSSFVNDGVFTYSRTYTSITDADGNTVIDNPAETMWRGPRIPPTISQICCSPRYLPEQVRKPGSTEWRSRVKPVRLRITGTAGSSA